MDVQDIKGIVLHIVGCLLIFYSGFMFGRATVPDHGNGTGAVRQELDRVEEYQRQAEQGVSAAAGTAAEITDTIGSGRRAVIDAQNAAEGITGAVESGRRAVGEAADTAARLDNGFARTGAILAECEQIIGSIQKRGAGPVAQE